MIYNQKQCKKMIRELNKRMRKISCTPESYTFIKIYQSVLELYALGEYQTAAEISEAVIKNI